VLKEKVHEDDRMAAGTALLTYYTNMNVSILWIRWWQIREQWSVNDFWSCKAGDQQETDSWLYIRSVSAAVIANTGSNTLSASSWQWALIECEWFDLLHLGQSMRCLIADIYKQWVGSLCRQLSKRYSRNSLPDNQTSIHVNSCQSVLMSVFVYKIGQHVVYRN